MKRNEKTYLEVKNKNWQNSQSEKFKIFKNNFLAEICLLKLPSKDMYYWKKNPNTQNFLVVGMQPN